MITLRHHSLLSASKHARPSLMKSSNSSSYYPLINRTNLSGINFKPITSIPYNILGPLTYSLTIQPTPLAPVLDIQITALKAFITLLIMDTNPTTDMVMVSVIYFRRLYQAQPSWLIRQSPCLIYTACLSLAFKFIQDAPHYTLLWSGISGFESKAINSAEREILYYLDYQLSVDTKSHQNYLQFALNHYQSTLITTTRPRYYLPYSISSPYSSLSSTPAPNTPPTGYPELLSYKSYPELPLPMYQRQPITLPPVSSLFTTLSPNLPHYSQKSIHYLMAPY